MGHLMRIYVKLKLSTEWVLRLGSILTVVNYRHVVQLKEGEMKTRCKLFVSLLSILLFLYITGCDNNPDDRNRSSRDSSNGINTNLTYEELNESEQSEETRDENDIEQTEYINNETSQPPSELYDYSEGLYFLDSTTGIAYVHGIGSCTDSIIMIPPYAPNGSVVRYIGREAFANCTNITTVVIPDTVTIISNSAFSNCSSLTTVIIPNSVTEIRDMAFQNCSSLSSIEIPNSVTSIGFGVFCGCSALNSVILPENIDYAALDSPQWFEYFDHIPTINGMDPYAWMDSVGVTERRGRFGLPSD